MFFVESDARLRVPARFVALSPLGTVVLALLVMLGPLRRATRMRPGEAVRTA